MLSHLRFHRRGPSNPTSPVLDGAPSPSWDSHSSQDVSPHPDARPVFSSSSNMPPSLPPIPRVTSSSSATSLQIRNDGPAQPNQSNQAEAQISHRPSLQPKRNGGKSDFIGGIALENYRRSIRDQDTAAANLHVPMGHDPRSESPPPPTHAGPTTAGSKAGFSFVTPKDRRRYSGGAPGKVPVGLRITTEFSTAHATANPAPEPTKSRKGLPFLKNPMSTLLSRRKNAQNPIDFSLVGMPAQYDQPAYDPRIRGTRFHDFSESRFRGPSANNRASSGVPITNLDTSSELQRSGDWQDSVHGTAKRLTLDMDKPLPRQPIQPSGSGSSSRESSSVSNAPSKATQSTSRYPKSASPVSRNVSMSTHSKRESVASAIPRHMKSTSSRFSFDMIGAAKQEKLLEERHRQRQLEAKAADPGVAELDSRFDDFDEDCFDYDAMMEDDGLEERIPGVNVDAEDLYGDEIDPDNDQENFAGFTFQRSNPQSSLASPHTTGTLVTPQDPNDNAVETDPKENASPELPSTTSSLLLFDQQPLGDRLDVPTDDSIRGLGIRGLNIVKAPPADTAVEEQTQQLQVTATPTAAPTAPAKNSDELYFDEGLADELAFDHEDTGFDESIFDLNDTDEYGRPIPGAFAKAQSEMIAQRQAAKRESNSTSRLSSQSILSPSTAHTSVSACRHPLAPYPADQSREPVVPVDHDTTEQHTSLAAVTGHDMAYQAALAEAAQKAAVLGKFRRGSSPPPPPVNQTTNPPMSSSKSHPRAENPLDGYEDEDDGFSNGLDDYDLDDDAIIAEANASALANDLDGIYGQEFGFYSAPVNQAQHGHGHPGSSGQAKPLSAENLYQYANGGYFGPAGGVNRSASGRIVSREPNLTPITERSEYSNRNSIMSLAVPSGVGSGGGGSVPLQSPGLAQLAMMADEDDMSLSALMRLRSRAWGGSQVSLASSRDGSPMSELGVGPSADGGTSPVGPNVLGVGPRPGHARKNSAFSLRSNSDAGSASGSPTLTMSVPGPLPSSPLQAPAISTSSPAEEPHRASSPYTACPPVPEAEEAEHDDGWAARRASGPGPRASMSSSSGEREAPAPPQAHQARAQGKGHRHKSSADSISYTMEEDSGETRWVIERRRTGESGRVEVLEREVVESGRI